jgi:hypothetical protein
MNPPPDDGDSSPMSSPAADDAEPTSDAVDEPLLLSRIALTWVELVVVGFTGAALGTATSGPPEFVVYLATTLATVAVLLYNVDRLIRDRIVAERSE